MGSARKKSQCVITVIVASPMNDSGHPAWWRPVARREFRSSGVLRPIIYYALGILGNVRWKRQKIDIFFFRFVLVRAPVWERVFAGAPHCRRPGVRYATVGCCACNRNKRLSPIVHRLGAHGVIICTTNAHRYAYNARVSQMRLSDAQNE